MPKISYIEKNFRAENLRLIKLVNQIVDQYEAEGYSLTLRQVYYQMVARDIIENSQRSYKNLGNLINDGRLAGLIDWHAIEDRTRNLRKRAQWNNPQHIISAVASQYHRDWWEGQTYYIEVWVEKDALVEVVGQRSEILDVPYFSCRGYVSQSELWGAAQRLKRRTSYGLQPVVLHLGDHDPSGKDMSRDIIERLHLFGVEDVIFHRIALNIEQVEEYNPPPNPTKFTDSRAAGYVKDFGYECWELDALEPRVIDSLINQYVTMYRDDDLYRKSREQEDSEIKQLLWLEAGYDVLIENSHAIAEDYGLEVMDYE